jgi:NAD(P)-dependent dehydrogenase (short-subunit alcohol dehydrogenase family)
MRTIEAIPVFMAGQRLVLITGVTRGLGRAMAELFIGRGHTVVGCGRTEKSVKALQSGQGGPHEFYAVDVASDTAVKSWASVVLAKYGPPDLLINNAGVINRNAPLWELDAREFDEVMHVNVRGVANMVRHFVPAMRERKTGILVNFSSGWGRSVDAEVAPYCASKWAIEGLTQALAHELPSTMAAVALNPGIVNTEMLRTCFGDAASAYPSPEQWAKAAVPFILKISPEDTGKSLSVPLPAG